MDHGNRGWHLYADAPLLAWRSLLRRRYLDACADHTFARTWHQPRLGFLTAMQDAERALAAVDAECARRQLSLATVNAAED